AVAGIGNPYQPRLFQAVDETRDVARTHVLELGQAAEADTAFREAAEHEEQLQPALAEPVALRPALLHSVQVVRRDPDGGDRLQAGRSFGRAHQLAGPLVEEAAVGVFRQPR